MDVAAEAPAAPAEDEVGPAEALAAGRDAWRRAIPYASTAPTSATAAADARRRAAEATSSAAAKAAAAPADAAAAKAAAAQPDSSAASPPVGKRVTSLTPRVEVRVNVDHEREESMKRMADAMRSLELTRQMAAENEAAARAARREAEAAEKAAAAREAAAAARRRAIGGGVVDSGLPSQYPHAAHPPHSPYPPVALRTAAAEATTAAEAAEQAEEERAHLSAAAQYGRRRRHHRPPLATRLRRSRMAEADETTASPLPWSPHPGQLRRPAGEPETPEDGDMAATRGDDATQAALAAATAAAAAAASAADDGRRGGGGGRRWHGRGGRPPVGCRLEVQAPARAQHVHAAKGGKRQRRYRR